VIQINLKSGSTIKFDLSTESGQLGWHDFCADPTVPTLVSGLGIHKDSQSYLIPIPKRSELVGIGGGILADSKRNRIAGEFVWYKTNKSRVVQTVYTNQHKLSKVEVEQI